MLAVYLCTAVALCPGCSESGAVEPLQDGFTLKVEDLAGDPVRVVFPASGRLESVSTAPTSFVIRDPDTWVAAETIGVYQLALGSPLRSHVETTIRPMHGGPPDLDVAGWRFEGIEYMGPAYYAPDLALLITFSGVSPDAIEAEGFVRRLVLLPRGGPRPAEEASP